MSVRLRLNISDLRQRLSRCTTDRSELWMGVLAMVWGTWVALPGSTFDSAPAAYATMRWIFDSEPAWGLLVAAVGLNQLAAWVSGRVRYRKAASFGMAMVWLLISAMFGIGDHRSAGAVVYFVHCLVAASAYLQLNRREV